MLERAGLHDRGSNDVHIYIFFLKKVELGTFEIIIRTFKYHLTGVVVCHELLVAGTPNKLIYAHIVHAQYT